MGVALWLIGRRLRRRWAGLVPLALIVAAGAGGSLVALGAADRTESAFADYLAAARVGDLQINPSLSTAQVDAVIRGLPGVRAVTTDVLLNAGSGDGNSAPDPPDSTDNAIEVRGSTDGRYVTMDRPALASGRLPTGPREAMVDLELAKRRHLHVGDELSLSFLSSSAELTATDPGATPPPVGTERLTVVGIATLADEVLGDSLYPRERVIVSPDVAARYACPPQSLPSDGTLQDLALAIFPGQCAVSYRYYSLRVAGGDRGVAAALDAFTHQAEVLNASVPQSLRDRGFGYALIPTATASERRRVDRSTQPSVIALVVLAAVAAFVTVVLAGLAAARELRRTAEDQLHWWRLGLGIRDRTLVVALPLLAAVAVGLVIGGALAWLLSPAGPVGNVRSIQPSPGRTVSPWVGLGAVALVAVLAVGVLLLAFRASRRAGRDAAGHRDVAGRRLAGAASRPEVSEGVRAAFDLGRGSGLVVATGAVAVSVLLAAVVCGASMARLVASPRSYGWPWDVAMVSNFGYGGLHLDAIEATMSGRHDVNRWAAMAFTNSVAVDGEPVVSMIGVGQGSDARFALARGRLPVSDHEVALGARTAAVHGVRVGEEVDLQGDGFPPRRATVTGLAVFPALGSFQSERASPGEGMLLPAAMFDPGDLAGLVTFVGVDLAGGTDQEAALASFRRDYQAWGADEFTVDFARPVRGIL